MGDAPPELPGYSIRSVLGAGGFGTVYLAEQTGLQREVALKVLHASVDAPVTRRRFAREAQILAGLNHPNLVRVFDFQDAGDIAFIALEYLPGGTLKDRLSGGRKLPPADVIALAKDLLNGLAALHAAGLVHRDVKPGNVLFRASGQAVVGDLGLSRSTSADATRLTRQGIVVGTIPYLAPEALTGSEQNASTDLFAAGVTLYEALAGRHPTEFKPFPPGYRPPDIASVCPDAPRGLCDLIRELLDPDPKTRPWSAGEVMPRLRSRTGGSGKSRGIMVPQSRSRARLAAAALAAVALTALIAGARWRPAATAPALDVVASSRHLTARVARTGAAFELQAYERALGRLVKSVKGSPDDGSTRFRLDGLSPDTAYDLALTAGPPGPDSPPLAQRPARTLGEVEVLGLDDATPSVWMRCVPSARVHEAHGHPVTVDERGTRVPLRDISGNATAALEVAFPSGARTQLDLDLPSPADRREGATLPLALNVRGLAGTVRDGARTQSVVDWLIAVRPAFVCLGPRADGLPDLDQPGIDALARAKIPLVPSVDPEAIATSSAWIPRAKALCAAGAIPRFIIQPHRVQRIWERQTVERGTEILVRARTLVQAGTGVDLWLPNIGERAGMIREKFFRKWSSPLGPIEALDREDYAEMGMNRMASEMHHEAESMRATLDVKVIFSTGSLVTAQSSLAGPMPTDRSTSARGLAFHLEDFPGAVVVHPLADFLKDGALTGSWYALERMARSLAGLKFHKRMGSNPPRVASAKEIHALCFQGGQRRAQVLVNLDMPAAATFTPAARGHLYVLDPAAASVEPDRTSTAPVELKLAVPPVLHVEWPAVKARIASGASVELIGRR